MRASPVSVLTRKKPRVVGYARRSGWSSTRRRPTAWRQWARRGWRPQEEGGQVWRRWRAWRTLLRVQELATREAGELVAEGPERMLSGFIPCRLEGAGRIFASVWRRTVPGAIDIPARCGYGIRGGIEYFHDTPVLLERSTHRIAHQRMHLFFLVGWKQNRALVTACHIRDDKFCRNTNVCLCVAKNNTKCGQTCEADVTPGLC